MIALNADTAIQVTESVGQSIDEVFGMMASEPAVQVGRSVVQDSHLDSVSDDEVALREDLVQESTQEDLTVTMSLDGDLQGTVGICLSQKCALEWTKSLIDHETTTIDQTVIDACGELGNMVVGGAKRRLNSFQLTMGLPNVILAGRSAMVFSTGVKPVNLEYEFVNSKFQVFVALLSE